MLKTVTTLWRGGRQRNAVSQLDCVLFGVDIAPFNAAVLDADNRTAAQTFRSAGSHQKRAKMCGVCHHEAKKRGPKNLASIYLTHLHPGDRVLREDPGLPRRHS